MDFGGQPFKPEPARGHGASAVCMIVRVETLPGADGDFIRLMADLQQRVRTQEPSCTAYTVTRMIGSSEHFAVHARFTGWRAFVRHSELAHVKAALPALMALLAAPPSLELFLEV